MSFLNFIGKIGQHSARPRYGLPRRASSLRVGAAAHGMGVPGLAVCRTAETGLDRDAAQSQIDGCGAGLSLDWLSVKMGLDSGDIRAWFQPKWALEGDVIVGAEALVRWEHSERGLLLPREFLPAIREHGLDHALLVRVLDDAVVAHLEWLGQGHDIPVSVNLPPPMLATPMLAEELAERVMRRGVSPSRINFELLEDEASPAQRKLQQGTLSLREKGFGLALDDFGRGYGSLYSLISAPFTEIKIDRAFVSGAAEDALRYAALTSSVLLGRKLGLTVTAEGVETAEDLEVLRSVGCDCAQGYFISPAISRKDFGRLLLNGPLESKKLRH